MARLIFETGHVGSRYHSNCAPLHTTSDTIMSYAFTQQSRETPTGINLSDLRLGSDGMKLRPAGSHHTRLSVGLPAVPSSSQPCMKLPEV